MTAIIGISAFYHDSAAAIVIDGQVIAAAQEERFTRKKHESGFPTHSVNYCLAEAGIEPGDLDHVGFYEKPLLKFDRLIETYLSFAPAGFRSFRKAVPEWTGSKIQLRREIRRGLRGEYKGRICFCEHHESHAASGFFPSPFEEAAIMTMDGVGEWTTTSLGIGEANRITLTDEIHFPHSLGLLYSAMTYFTGFEVNAGEYKLMGLAPFGQPKYVDLIRDHLITIFDDGSYELHLEYFNYCQGLTMTSRRFHRLFARAPRTAEQPIEQLDMDLAASIQKVTEEVVLRSARHLHDKTGMKNLCLAGGVALNCVANGRLLREGPFEKIWIQPAAGDAGGAMGVAMLIWHQLLNQPRQPQPRQPQTSQAQPRQHQHSDGPQPDRQQGSLLGPPIDTEQAAVDFQKLGAHYQVHDDPSELHEVVAKHLAAGRVVGRAQGRMEFGPRALGNRSILADARVAEMQSVLNLKIKFRESFRPFAPIVLADRAHDFFELPEGHDSPYMLIVTDIRKQHRVDDQHDEQHDEKPEHQPAESSGLQRVSEVRSSLPAITHVDYTARIQTVDAQQNPALADLLEAFDRQTGCPVLVNTSFNVRDEPIVCTSLDALACFMATDMDVLVVENMVLCKEDQSKLDVDGLADLRRAEYPEAKNEREISLFVASLVVSLGMVAAITHSRFHQIALTTGLTAIAIVIAISALVFPRSRARIRDGFIAITLPVRFVVTLLALGIVYFGVVTPIGLLRRLGGHAIQVRPKTRTTTWAASKSRELSSYFNTY